MSGQGPFTDADLTVDSRFKVLRAADHSGQNVGEFYPAAPRLGHSGSQMGPADFFGRKMVELLPEDISVAVANISIGGQSIDLFDKATSANYISTARNADEWWIPYLDEYGGDAYQRIIEMGQIAKQQGVIKGILFHQGEADANRADWGDKVKKVYEDIVNDLGLDAAKVPILMGELLRTEEGGDLGWRNADVAQAVSNIPNGHLISAVGCPGLVEPNYTLHFTREGYEILGERYAQTMFGLLEFPGLPSVEITAPSVNDDLFSNQSIPVSIEATDDDGSIVKVELYDNDVKVGELLSEPYSFVWQNPSEGMHTLKAVAIDNDNNKGVNTKTIKINIPQTPFENTPYAVPGKIECENFDIGGNGSAYYDTDEGTNVSPDPGYRDEDVDIEVCSDVGGGYNLGFTMAGEWLEYTVDVAHSGTYDIVLRASTDGAGKTVSLTSKGAVLAENVPITNTSGWQEWADITISDVKLEAGEQVLRLTIGNANYVNLNYMTFISKDIPLESIPLTAGWNLIGCPLDGSTEISDALSSIWDNVLIVKDFDSFYMKEQADYFNLLQSLEWGKGYLVKVSDDCELEW